MVQVKSELRGTEREKKESFRPCGDSLEPAEKARLAGIIDLLF